MDTFPNIKPPRYPLAEMEEENVLIHRNMDVDTEEQRIKIRSKSYRRVRASWRRLSAEDKDKLLDFFDDMESLMDYFYLQDFWCDTTYIARFDTQTIEFQHFINNFWHSQSLTFVIIEEVAE